MASAILITQCMQHDFVAKIASGVSLPNLLHIGQAESQRLLGIEENNPVARFIAWAEEQDESALEIIHIRDWHNNQDPKQHSHLAQFGEHCLANTPGANFVFQHRAGTKFHVVNSTTLNDFEDTGLSALLENYKGQAPRVGITGVWTEAKVYFLAYELATRYPTFQIAVCSALTASSSWSQHFYALEQLKRIIGVRVIDSIGEFIDFLGGDADDFLPITQENNLLIDRFQQLELASQDEQLLRYLFRDCKRIELNILDGGFSGNLVAAVSSTDRHGHKLVPHVVKIGPRTEMARERTAFEQIESVMGNNAPAIADYADLSTRGAIKYRYASMGSGDTSTFQSRYMRGESFSRIENYLAKVFDDQLGRFYRAAVKDSRDLLAYYEFDSKWANSIKQKIKGLLGQCPESKSLILPEHQSCPNLYLFYRDKIQQIPPLYGDFPFSFVHGDLNGANIIIDESENIWLIDFFHTHRGHLLKDFSKLENDILYIYTAIETDHELKQAYEFTDWLLSIKNPFQLEELLPKKFQDSQFEMAYKTLRRIRKYALGFMPLESENQSRQWQVAQLRYAVHTIGFDEPNTRQRIWALYSASRLSELISVA